MKRLTIIVIIIVLLSIANANNISLLTRSKQAWKLASFKSPFCLPIKLMDVRKFAITRIHCVCALGFLCFHDASWCFIRLFVRSRHYTIKCTIQRKKKKNAFCAKHLSTFQLTLNVLAIISKATFYLMTEQKRTAWAVAPRILLEIKWNQVVGKRRKKTKHLPSICSCVAIRRCRLPMEGQSATKETWHISANVLKCKWHLMRFAVAVA